MPTEHDLTHPLVGPVRYRVTEARSRAPVTLLDDYVAEQITEVRLPQLQGKPGPAGRPCDGRVRFHTDFAPQLQAAWQEVADEGLLDRVLAFGGAFEPRLVTTLDDQPTEQLSSHALGLAFDVNPADNPLGQDTCRFGLAGGVRELVPLFERHGFRWGGYDRDRRDGSHFELRFRLDAGQTLPTRATLVKGEEYWCGTVAMRSGDEFWAEATVVARQLGGQAKVEGPRAPGPVPVAVLAGGQPVTLEGQWRGNVAVVPLDKLLDVFNMKAEPQPGKEHVHLVAR